MKTDWEVELAIVIGTRASYVGESEALDYVAGYCLCHDVSERAFQIERSGQWMKGKGCPTFGPLGPWLVTDDEIADAQKLDMWLDVNGERMQKGSTATMIFGVRKLVSYISHFMILEPGDVITTGTPPGVGMGKKPPRFLKAGDTVSLGIEGLGQQAQRVVAWKKASLSPKRPDAPVARQRGSRRMRPLKSIAGATFAALYAIAFIAAYVDYRGHVGEWFADLGLILLALPFVLTMRLLTGGSFDMTGEDRLKLLAAALFCCVLAWLIGSALEWLARRIFRLARGRRPSRARRRSL